MELDLPWISSIKSNLENIGLLNFYTGDYSAKPPFVYKKLFQRLSDIFHQETFSKINVKEVDLEHTPFSRKNKVSKNIWWISKTPMFGKNVIKFRLSNHKLMIEVGRHQKIDAEQRFCPFCPDAVEDEFHFLLYCPTYNIQRSAFLDPITSIIHNFSMLPDSQKFELVMSHMDPDLCCFVSNTMDIREFLVNNPRRLQ